jgi:hypothetical protein
MMPEADDQELFRLINQPQAFADADGFERKTLRRLGLQLMWRKAVIGLAGVVGGIYALGQFVHLPDSPQKAENYATSPGLVRASVTTEETFSQGLRWLDGLSHRLADGMQWLNRSVDFMHQPAFFWGSFAICVTLMVLYFAQSQEEML